MKTMPWNMGYRTAVLVAVLAIGIAALGVFLGDYREESQPLSAGEALRRLQQGNARYAAHHLKHPDQSAHRMHAVEQGQHPFAVILGCSDSRVPPEIIFDQGLGDLFVIRVAGAVPGDEVLGSIEYAVEHLQTSLVVVLGHEQCGAVAAVAAGEAHEGHTGSFLDDIEPYVVAARGLPGDLAHNLMCISVDGFAWRIRQSEPILTERVASGKVKVLAAHYELHTGKVRWHREPLE
jgi:carbonic anhydrase